MSSSSLGSSSRPRIFISLRFSEASREAKMLKAGLEAKGIPTFLCSTAVGDEIATDIANAIDACELALIMGSKTYGLQTDANFSTHEELGMILEDKKPFFLVKMCDRFEVPRTRLFLRKSIAYFPWQPGTSMPSGLVDEVISKLSAVNSGTSTDPTTEAGDVLHQAEMEAAVGPTASAPPHGATDSSAILASADEDIRAGDEFKKKGAYRSAVQCYEKALSKRVEAYGDEHVKVAECYVKLCDGSWKDGKVHQAVEYGNEAVRLYDASPQRRSHDAAMAHHHLGNALNRTAEYDDSLLEQQLALRDVKRTVGEEHEDYAKVLHGFGNAYSNKADYDKAIDYYNKSLTVRLATLGENHPDSADSYMGLGLAYYDKGDYDRAIDYHNKSLTVKLATLGENHPDTARSYNNLGNAYKNKGDYDRAIDYYNKDLTITLATLGENHPDTATSYNNLGIAYRNKGDYDRAIDYYNKSLTVRLATLGENHPDTAASYNNLGSAYYSKGDYDRAIDYYNKSLTVKLATLGENHPSTAMSHYNMSLLAKKQGDMATARHHASKAYDIRLTVLGPDHPHTRASKRVLDNL